MSSLNAQAQAQAQAPRPAAGVTVDESRTVTLLAAMPAPCIAIALEGATVFLDKAEVGRAAASRPKAWTTEPERQALIAGKRAEGLLSQLSPTKDALGCFTLASPIDAETQSYVLSALEAGAAAVRDAATGQLAATVRIRYQGDRCGPKCGRGSVLVYLPEATRFFLIVSWWVA